MDRGLVIKVHRDLEEFEPRNELLIDNSLCQQLDIFFQLHIFTPSAAHRHGIRYTITLAT